MVFLSKSQATQNNNIFYLLAYIFTIVSGVVLYLFFAKDDKKLKLHSEQSIILGVIIIVLGAILFLVPYIAGIAEILVWLYGIYVGVMAYGGTDVNIPYITDFVKQHGM